jgi:multidrug resistance efflux pump
LEKQLDAARAIVVARKEQAKAADAAIEQSQKGVQVAQAQLEAYQAELNLAEITLKRQEELFTGKAATEQQIDDMRAKASVMRAQARVGEAKLAAAQADVRAAQAARAVAEAQVGVADAEAGRLATLLAYTKVVAPFDGVVTRRLVNRGDLVQAGAGNRTPLFTVQRIDMVRVFCDVPEASAAGVVPGAAATVKVYGLGGQVIEGKVTRISMAISPEARNMRTEIDLPNPQKKLRSGMYAEVKIMLQAPAPVADAPAKP